tara:strand:+ start:7465 stop:7833 length:369 start_codon:yes stop_codon:yes gene_type:complete
MNNINPLGKTYKEYQEELEKVNLTKAEKVELAGVKELEKYEIELEKGIDELMQYATDAREAIAKGVRELNRLDAVKKVATRILGDTQEAAKELGVKVPQIQKLERMIKAYEQQRKSLTKVLK